VRETPRRLSTTLAACSKVAVVKLLVSGRKCCSFSSRLVPEDDATVAEGSSLVGDSDGGRGRGGVEVSLAAQVRGDERQGYIDRCQSTAQYSPVKVRYFLLSTSCCGTVFYW